MPGPAPHDQGARAFGDDDELRARADRRRFRRPAPSRVLGPRLGRAFAAGRRIPAHGRRHRRCGALHGDAVRQRGAQPQPRRFLHLARSAAAAVRGSADPAGAAAVGLVQPQHAFPVDRHAHRGARWRARRVFPRHPQPDRGEGRAVGDAGPAAAADRRAQSRRRAGPPDADPSHGRGATSRRSCRRCSMPCAATAAACSGSATRCTAIPKAPPTATRPGASTTSAASSSRRSTCMRRPARAWAACTWSSPAKTSPNASAARAS